MEEQFKPMHYMHSLCYVTYMYYNHSMASKYLGLTLVRTSGSKYHLEFCDLFSTTNISSLQDVIIRSMYFLYFGKSVSSAFTYSVTWAKIFMT